MSAQVESLVAGPVGAAVVEVLGSLIAPGLREQLLGSALRGAGLRVVPEDPIRVRDFVEGELNARIVDAVGQEAAAFVMTDLAPILELAVRRVGTDSQVVACAPFLPASRPPRRSGARESLAILVATLGSLEELKMHLGSFATVQRACDPFELFSAIEIRSGPALVVLDGFRRAVELSTIATFMPRVPDGCRVALWGFDALEAGRYTPRAGWSTLDASVDWGSLSDALVRMS